MSQKSTVTVRRSSRSAAAAGAPHSGQNLKGSALTCPQRSHRDMARVYARSTWRKTPLRPRFAPWSPIGGLAVAVREGLEPCEQPDAAEGNRVRARVVADVVRLLRPVGEVGDAVRAGDDRVGDARARRPRDDVSGTQLVRFALDSELGRCGGRPELERAAALQHDERLGLERVDVRDRAALAGRPPDRVEPGALRPGRRGEQLVSVLVEGQLVEGDHVRRPLARLRELELADSRLELPRVVDPSLGPDVAEAQRPRAGEPAVLDRVARPEDEVVETVGPALEGVLEVIRDLDDRVAGAHLADGFVLPLQPGAREHVINLLGEPVRARRRREPAWVDPHTGEPDALRAGRIAERLPRSRHRPLLSALPLDIVPVHKHERSIPASRLRRPEAAPPAMNEVRARGLDPQRSLSSNGT